MKTATEMNRMREELVAKKRAEREAKVAEREAKVAEFCEAEVMGLIESATAYSMNATRVRTNLFTNHEIMDYVQKFGYTCEVQGWDIVITW